MEVCLSLEIIQARGRSQGLPVVHRVGYWHLSDLVSAAQYHLLESDLVLGPKVAVVLA